jgi:hypothetical protein
MEKFINDLKFISYSRYEWCEVGIVDTSDIFNRKISPSLDSYLSAIPEHQ